MMFRAHLLGMQKDDTFLEQQVWILGSSLTNDQFYFVLN